MDIKITCGPRRTSAHMQHMCGTVLDFGDPGQPVLSLSRPDHNGFYERGLCLSLASVPFPFGREYEGQFLRRAARLIRCDEISKHRAVYGETLHSAVHVVLDVNSYGPKGSKSLIKKSGGLSPKL
ncbi:uncharacterized protein PHALS_10426 [Plasmopara halstedii]|uniref:Uncharacterized protein n=1 Tax=Plasmopara halstedii TaxID=4781 RepID=A0A0P1AHK3_PLAHL|nr:uncharacterized protein PHALS_10426 [Plasmopara halstedii]CEG40214.1 hypothetical protein PHALS_10426 [Plasmopara halstedii]|eukprot:XP_024576583.1 hypothetical protein PHALS_10426 [Plasmopara halstedii]